MIGIILRPKIPEGLLACSEKYFEKFIIYLFRFGTRESRITSTIAVLIEQTYGPLVCHPGQGTFLQRVHNLVHE